MSKFFNYRLSTLAEYVAGEQPQGGEFIKLNTNESPYSPSPLAIEQLKNYDTDKLKLYPDIEAKLTTDAISKNYGVNSKNVLVSNASDEILSFVFQAFGSDKQGFCFPDITYGFYSVYCNLYSVKYNQISLTSDFRIDLSDYKGCDDSIIIANPNAVTGVALSSQEIESLVKENTNRLVVVDEAYVDFGGESVVELTKIYDNLLAVQTYSKSRNLAGARLGFAIGAESLINDLKKIKFSFHPYAINALTNILGASSMMDKEYFLDCMQKIKRTRENFVAELKALKFEVVPSSSNFVLCKFDKINGQDLYLKLKEKGVLVRWFDSPRLKDYLRITIGNNEQMKTTIEKLTEIVKEKLYEKFTS